MKFNVINRFSGNVQFEAEIDCTDDSPTSVKIGLAVKLAIMSRANLYGADLSGANLPGANLYKADLSRANLSRADLSRANLSGANLPGANLPGANLSRANLSRADLYGANLSGANLSGANLCRADLYGANLSGANLYQADLYGADLSRANLYRANNADLIIARTRILPEGQLIGWKQCRDKVIVKLSIPAEAKRSHAFGRKCRAEFADVLEVFGAIHGESQHDATVIYRVGERVTCHRWDDNWQNECSAGIHFYLTKIEAENH